MPASRAAAQDGDVVLVTGVRSGIGLRLARLLWDSDYRVIATAREVVALLARCLSPGGRLVFAERPEVGMAALLANSGLQPQQEADGGFMVGVADKPEDAPDEGSAMIGRESRATRRARAKQEKKDARKGFG